MCRCNDKDLQAPWIGNPKDSKEEQKVNFLCEWCDEFVYEGESYYDICGEKVCVECISNCKREG